MKINKATTIPLKVTGGETLPQCRQPVSVAVPFRQGILQEPAHCRVSVAEVASALSAMKVTSQWPDGSVKWAVVKTVLEPEAGSYSDMSVQCVADSTRQNPDLNLQPLRVVQSNEQVTVWDGDIRYVFEMAGQQLFPQVFSGDSQLWHEESVQFAASSADTSALECVKTSLTVEEDDALSALIIVRGQIAVSSLARLEVSLHFEILRGSWLRLGVRIHNPHRAQHPEFLWDLGDKGSIHFNELALRIAKGDNESVRFRPEPHGDWVVPSAAKTTLFQASSGGDNWDSPNHVNASGEMCNRFKGYRVEADGAETQQGLRASPLVWIDNAKGGNWGLKLPYYWQNFPKCLGFDDASTTLGLFPAEHGVSYELQGGERKHHDIIFSFSGDSDSLEWVDQPRMLIVDKSAVTDSQVLRYSQNGGSDDYNNIIANSLCARTGIAAKREFIDEYGWRNFGDIYADHETLYHDSDEVFVSHYNNQYDPIYGFGRQYLLTGDTRWYELMVELAQHVLDIDIYRTDEDRAEYNYGPFWHTVHYEKAYTSSHRTYSHKHYIDWHGEKGGGPGKEHCYTSGLVLLYHLTGNKDALDSVVGMTGWIRHFYEGTGTLLETCKNIISIERRKLIPLCKGEKIFRYRYGLDRGCGNYMRSLLDSFELTGDKSCISETEVLFMNTFSSNDDLVVRHLDNIESMWSYSIFLQEIIRYLDLKRGLGELDEAFSYARDGLLHYARWMSVNETPFLSNPERLEFPNDTWVAQDIRKANVLYAAYRYAIEDREAFLTKARQLRDYVLQALSESNTLHFSRIQILMLQNHGPAGLMDSEAEPYSELDQLAMLTHIQPQQDCFYTLSGFLSEVLGQVGRAIRNFSLSRELSWVRTRRG